MDADWDLHAVVRGCTAAVTNTTTVSNTTATTTNNPFPSFPSSSFHDDQNSFDFPNLIDDRNFSDPYQGLHEIYQELCGDDPPHTTAAAADISATSIMSIPAGQVFQPHQEVVPPFQMNMQNIQENTQFNNRLGSSSQNFPAATIPQPIRPRRRKNQQTKMVRQMTQEELSADSWAWRKYGQKPIKGSPYPRNYYRCSTSKGCAARKQVERSPNDPRIFVVSYTGEHTHPRPTHRSSLAGSTRSKFVSTKNINNTNAFLSQKGSASSSSRATGSSFFPTTPSMEGEAAAQNDDVEMAEEDDGAGDEDDENMITIPNDLMNDDDDIFKGFQDSDDHSSGGGGDLFTSGLLSPPWSPTGSAGNAATFSGGGSG